MGGSKHFILSLFAWKRLYNKDKKRRFKVPLSRQLYCWKKGFLPESYVIYGLDKNDYHLYLSDFKRTTSTIGINNKSSVILDEKLVFCNHFQNNSRIIKPVIYLKNKLLYEWASNEVVPNEQLPVILGNDEYVVKPSGGGGGFGIFFIDIREQLKIDGKHSDWDTLIKMIHQTPGALIFKKIRQTGFAHLINPESLNTIRILTMLDPVTNKAFIGHAVFRCGTSKSGSVDNWSNGGLSAKVDIESGGIGQGVTFPYQGKLEWYSHHPETGVQIEGVKIPEWETITREVIQLANSMYYIPYIGWDVVPMENDFLILEANSNSDVNLLQVHEPLLKNERIKEFYKHYKVI